MIDRIFLVTIFVLLAIILFAASMSFIATVFCPDFPGCGGGT